jgi:hypothetical protein
MLDIGADISSNLLLNRLFLVGLLRVRESLGLNGSGKKPQHPYHCRSYGFHGASL